MINIKNLPTLFGETSSRYPKFETLDALKSSHVSFNGYGVLEGEQVVFPTKAEVDANPRGFIKTMASYEGSQNRSAFIAVTRIQNGKSRESWFNLSNLTRQAYQNGQRVDIDQFRTDMRALHDDKERVEALLGKTLEGGAPVRYDRAIFKDNRPTGEYEPYDYVTIKVVDTKKK